jgi:hypothetical protein
MQATFILANEASAIIQLADMPYDSGFFTITSPFGTPIKIANLKGKPDYIDAAIPWDYPITPPYDPTNETVQGGVYQIIVYNAGNPAQTTTSQYTLPSSAKSAAAIAIAVAQDCLNNTASFIYTGAIPVDATNITYLWTITAPDGTTTTETTSQIVINPTVEGGYIVAVAITYTTAVSTSNGSETFITRTAKDSIAYKKSCGNAQSILCDVMYCCIKAALYKFIDSPTWGNGADLLAKLGAGFLMQLAITCNKRQDAQLILDKLNTKFDCHACGDCSGCK